MSKENDQYNPTYRVQVNPETGRLATYWSYENDLTDNARIHQWGRVPAMPKYRTKGNPLGWRKGQVWERAVQYEEDKKTPKWERIRHAGMNAEDAGHPEWEEKSKVATTMPKWADFPQFRYNYFVECWEIKHSPFEDYRLDERDRAVKNVDHRGFIKLWYSGQHESIASIAKHLGWNRSKVQRRKVIVQQWLDKWEKHKLTLKYKAEFTESEREEWLSQHGAPSAKDIAGIASYFGIKI